METNTNTSTVLGQVSDEQLLSDRELLLNILQNTRKTKNYMKWQLYITVALVVLPLLAMLLIIPMVVSSIGNLSGMAGLVQ